MAKSKSWLDELWRIFGPLAVVCAAVYSGRDNLYEILELSPRLRILSEARNTGGENQLVLTNDLAEINGKVRLSLQVPEAAVAQLRATISKRTSLLVDLFGIAGNLVVVDVRPLLDLKTEYFKWPPGDELVVAHPRAPLVLRDWRISTEKGLFTRADADYRRYVDWVFLIIGIFGGTAAIAKAVQDLRDKKDGPPGDSPPASPWHIALSLFIDHVKGDNEKETARLRAYLKSPLIDRTTSDEADEAVKALGRISRVQLLQIRAKAIRRMRARLEEFGSDVAKWQTILDNASRADVA